MFKFKVKGQHLTVIEKPMTVSDTIKYLSASFEFSEDWDGLDKWAHFKKGETTYDINLVNDAIPASAGLNLASGSYKVYLHGSAYTGETTVQRITTSAVIVTVQQADVLNGQPLPTVPPSATEQILAKVSNASNKADAAALSASSAQASATSAQTSATAAATSASQAAASASGKYTKPQTGIPKTDLASAVQTSLGKADSALQEHQSLSAYRTASEQDEIDNGLAENINSLVDTKYEVPQGGIPSTDMTEAVQTSLGLADTALQEHQSLSAYRTSAEQDVIDSEKVSDIKINGTSIVSDGVGNIPMATQTEAGVFKPYNGNSSYGLSVDANRGVLINKAVDGDINSRVNGYKPIVPSNLDYAVKAAMCDGRGADWSEAEQKMARKRMNASMGDLEKIADFTITEENCRANWAVTRDMNNQPFQLKRAIIVLDAPATSDTTQTVTSGYYVISCSVTNAQTALGALNFFKSPSQNSRGVSVCEISVNEDYPAYAVFNAEPVKFAYAATSTRVINFGNNEICVPYIDTISTNKNSVTAAGHFVVGTRFIIYGERY